MPTRGAKAPIEAVRRRYLLTPFFIARLDISDADGYFHFTTLPLRHAAAISFHYFSPPLPPPRFAAAFIFIFSRFITFLVFAAVFDDISSPDQPPIPAAADATIISAWLSSPFSLLIIFIAEFLRYAD
jgi:hypothetical protein